MSENEQVETNADDELGRVREALKNANSEAATHRHKATELQTELERVASYKDKFVQSQIALKLGELGVSNPKIVRLLDKEKLSLDESDNLIGLEEQLEQAKADFPELFGATVATKTVSIDAADKPKPKRAVSSAERLIRNRRA